jgi:hypothetical protein
VEPVFLNNLLLTKCMAKRWGKTEEQMERVINEARIF